MSKRDYLLALIELHIEQQRHLKNHRQALDAVIKETALSPTPPFLPRKMRQARNAYMECKEKVSALTWALTTLSAKEKTFDEFTETAIRTLSRAETHESEGAKNEC